jgi:hypothetical protein
MGCIFKILAILASGGVGLVLEFVFFGFAPDVFHVVGSGRYEMGGIGAGIAALAGGVVGALGGGVAAACAGSVRWWFPVALPAVLGAFMVIAEAHWNGNLMTKVLNCAPFPSACALVGLLVACSGAGIARLLRVDGVSQIQEHLSPEYQVPFDRFRDNLVSPVPKSVANLRFVALNEQIRPDLMLQFDIDRADLDAILQEVGLKPVAPDTMLNPNDCFRFAYYMPIEGDYHLFQGKDKVGEVLTVKTSESHSHAIFRRETSQFYRDRGWENGRLCERDEESLEKIRKNYESTHKHDASRD